MFGGHVGIFQLLIVFMLIVVLFGTKRLRQLGNDLGRAVKDFRKSIADESHDQKPSDKNL